MLLGGGGACTMEAQWGGSPCQLHQQVHNPFPSKKGSALLQQATSECQSVQKEEMQFEN